MDVRYWLRIEEFESAISAVLPIPAQAGELSALRPLKAYQFLEVTRLLEIYGKYGWSLRPRTYSILRMAKRTDGMDAFIAEGLYDISLPYSERTLPDNLKSPTTRSDFLALQPLVLSEQASEVESGEGRHRHFSEDGNLYFRRIKRLGGGGFGEVDHVWNKAAITEFWRELGILKLLSHHNLVKLVGSYTDPKYAGLIMSPVADSNLAEFLGADPFPTGRVSCLRQFYGCLTSALLYLHSNKIRHKDIKPGNILVHGENVLFTDFGASLDWAERGQSTTVSKPDSFSMPYCAPEVFSWEIKAMVKLSPSDRLSVFQLSEEIRNREGAFCGSCCAVEDDESVESSYQGSLCDEETTAKAKDEAGVAMAGGWIVVQLKEELPMTKTQSGTVEGSREDCEEQKDLKEKAVEEFRQREADRIAGEQEELRGRGVEDVKQEEVERIAREQRELGYGAVEDSRRKGMEKELREKAVEDFKREEAERTAREQMELRDKEVEDSGWKEARGIARRLRELKDTAVEDSRWKEENRIAREQRELKGKAVKDSKRK
ncbi:hypothetical protein FGG08_002858 [Glutinoglossum americanum]|uniref:Protein kinase domain-containing protein n=1 Tax=Glutinoglossum americanum TaxID=1670608 RepID=A0A9P8I8I4_9PEZI|nr:hypothetical protein FGG08_002858 [Glutinoglossum americanum]